jgi:hypothetical protein
MKPESSLPISQEPATGLYPESRAQSTSSHPASSTSVFVFNKILSSHQPYHTVCPHHQGTQMVPQTLDSIDQLTWLTAPEDFIKFICREILK